MAKVKGEAIAKFCMQGFGTPGLPAQKSRVPTYHGVGKGARLFSMAVMQVLSLAA
jgi:hypothetical protein